MFFYEMFERILKLKCNPTYTEERFLLNAGCKTLLSKLICL